MRRLSCISGVLLLAAGIAEAQDPAPPPPPHASAIGETPKSVTTARLLGILPGFGHFYAGEPGRGLAFIGGLSGIMVIGMLATLATLDDCLEDGVRDITNPSTEGSCSSTDAIGNITAITLFGVWGVRRGLLALCSPQISPECDSYLERVVWGGADLLYEHREGGSQYTGGSVGYVQGGVIDQPLAQLDGRILNPNWRGLYESSVLPNGTRGDCSLPGSGACTTVSWPAGQGVYYIRFPVSGGGNPSTWIGSLASNGEGSTGLLYRRNRFYDPATGQFTQQDPIGIAGGLNQYGYAQGDPVNFSDPFGLCGPATPLCLAAAALAGRILSSVSHHARCSQTS
jgi:RHS repeat-associated protein